jgi:hypothetical protein
MQINLNRPALSSVMKPHPVDEYTALFHEMLDKPGKIDIGGLENAHRRIDSSLHRSANQDHINLSAFIYSAERLPACLPLIKWIILGSTEKVFVDSGFGHVLLWNRVDAHRRRRRAHFDGRNVLAVLVNNITDYDDLIPSLCAYQIEWNAMHRRLQSSPLRKALAEGRDRVSTMEAEIRRLFNVNEKDWELLRRLWADNWDRNLQLIAEAPKNIIVERLPLRAGDFKKTFTNWFEAIQNHFDDIDFEARPMYIVSSNTHSLVNLVSGFARHHQDEIMADTLDQIIDDDDAYLQHYWKQLKHEDESLRFNFLYYAQRSFLDRHPEYIPQMIAQEESVGIRRCNLDHYLNLEAQVIELDKIDCSRLDSSLKLFRVNPDCKNKQFDRWKQEKALIFNFDYPLGYAAYNLMKLILAGVQRIKGVFILGKSAAMIGRIGDIMIPNEVRDVHSAKLYRFRNVFSAGWLAPYLSAIAVFDEQRTLTVRGTFLHSRESVKDYRGIDFTGIEMETGPYLSALYEHLEGMIARDKKILDVRSPYPIGVLHYTSDTPYNLRASLLSQRMSAKGLEATYACSRAILDCIAKIE